MENNMSEQEKTQRPNKSHYHKRRRGPKPQGQPSSEVKEAVSAPEASEVKAPAEAGNTVGTSANAHKKPRHKSHNRHKNSGKQKPEEKPSEAAEEVKSDPVKERSDYRTVPDYWYEDKPEPTPEPEYDESKLVDIVGVRFKENGKIYYFAPMDYVCHEEQSVIVETARGIEFGTIAIANRKERPETLVAPLRPVVRIATQADIDRHDENVRREAEAFKLCEEKITQHGLEMKLIDAEYTFDNSKLTFYFCADGRIDFRELVKSLASVFRTRIELRQIGIRDEAKMLGGLGICGRPFCCSTFLYDFNQVSIRMAKEQNLSLNSAKISGTCGRLMCCLRYECETYEAEMKLTPRVDSTVKTPDGIGTVIEALPMLASVRVKLGDADDAPIKVFSRDDVTVIGRKQEKKSEE